MSNDLFCFAKILIAIGAGIWMIILVRGMNAASPGMFQGWRDEFEAWREARTPPKHGLVILLAVGQITRMGAIAILAAIFTFLAAAIGAICSPEWKEMRKMLNDFYNFLLR